jgi:hypothetical protein
VRAEETVSRQARNRRETESAQHRGQSMNNGVRPMLAEKFFLVLEALIKGQNDRVPTYSDGAPRVVSSSAHVPVVLPVRSLRS